MSPQRPPPHPLIDLRCRAVATTALVVDLQALADDGEARVVTLLLNGDTRLDSTPNPAWFERLPLPLIGAWAGDVSGPAAALALSCDIRLCAEGASLAAPPAVAARLALLLGGREAPAGQAIDAPGLLDFGLVSGVYPAESLETEAERLAAVIASRGPIATRLAKEAVWRGLALPLEAALRFETDLTLLLQTTKDRAEGVRAFLEKRPPIFTGD